MYLYLGQDTVINTDDIIGIFDLENTSISRLTKAFLASSQKGGQIVEVSAEIPRSFVVCERMFRLCRNSKRVGEADAMKSGSNKVYLSQISPSTLKKRSYYIKELANL